MFPSVKPIFSDVTLNWIANGLERTGWLLRMHMHACNLLAGLKQKHDQNLQRPSSFSWVHVLPLLSSFFHHDNHKIYFRWSSDSILLLFPLFFLKLQRGLHDDRSILGHQSRPAWVIHAFLAPQPRRGRQHGERREPPVRVHHAHRLPTQVLHQTLSVLSIYQVSFFYTNKMNLQWPGLWNI